MNLKLKKLSKMFLRVRKHRGKRNVVSYQNSGFWKCKFKFKGFSNRIISEDSLFYKCVFLFAGSNNLIKIDKNSKFKNVTFCIEGDNNVITIGKNASFCGKTEIVCLEGTKVTIGNNILSSSDVYIKTSDSHSIYDFDHKRVNIAKDVIIGNNVWLCQKASILKGSIIPNNCVVAYGSIVTKQFHDSNCIFGGNPAKIIKKNIEWGEER